MKPSRALIGIILFLSVFLILPASKALSVKTAGYSFLEGPIAFSREISQMAVDLMRFKKNADELRQTQKIDHLRNPDAFQIQSLRLENERLNRMLDMRATVYAGSGRAIFSRVIARSPSAWNRVFLIDKGQKEGIYINMAVMAEGSLVGKVIEVGESVAKVQLFTDPNSRIGAVIQRTRQQGILYGTFTGECRLKYLAADAVLQEGDMVESAGYGGLFPKGLFIGKIEKFWKEPGQIYQVAQIKPAADLSRVEEVACLV